MSSVALNFLHFAWCLADWEITCTIIVSLPVVAFNSVPTSPLLTSYTIFNVLLSLPFSPMLFPQGQSLTIFFLFITCPVRFLFLLKIICKLIGFSIYSIQSFLTLLTHSLLPFYPIPTSQKLHPYFMLTFVSTRITNPYAHVICSSASFSIQINSAKILLISETFQLINNHKFCLYLRLFLSYIFYSISNSILFFAMLQYIYLKYHIVLDVVNIEFFLFSLF